jgi:NADH oxidase (H2O2-forming)
MQTSIEDVYACGDCVEAKDVFSGKSALYLLWHNAKQQGEVAGNSCLGNRRIYPGSSNITGINIYGVHAASVGTTYSLLGQPDEVEVIEKRYGANYYRLIISKGMLLGVQAVGRTKDVGMLLSALLRKENLSKFPKRIELDNKWGYAYNLWRYRLSQYVKR